MTVRAQKANSWILSLLTLLMLGCAVSEPVSASMTPGPEFRIASVLTSAYGNQESVDVCAGGTLYMAVWQDKRNGNDFDIYGTILDANGNPTVAESFLISKMAGGAGAVNDQLCPTVGWNGTNFLVAWTDRRASNLIPRIYATRVTTSGQVLDEGGIAFPTTPTPTDQIYQDIASNGSNWEVVWQETSSTGSHDIYATTVSAAGAVGTRLAVASRSDNEEWPAIAWNGANYLVVWQDYRNSESTGIDIYGLRLTSAGAKVAGSEIQVSGAAQGQTVPAVAAASTGMWLVVWQDARSGVDADIYGARVSSAGALQDAAGKVVSTAASDQESPSIGWDGTYFLAAWRDKSASRGIRAIRLDTSANLVNPVISVTDTATGSDGPSVACRSGSSLIGWYTLDMSYAEVYGTKVTSGGSAGSAIHWSNCMQDQAGFSAAFDGTNYVVVWSDKRSGMYQIYAARIAPDGTVLDTSGVPVTTSATGAQTEPAIAWDGTNYLVVWAEMGAFFTDIKGMRLTPSLTRVDASSMLISYTTGSPTVGADLDQLSPAVAWSGTQYLVVWVDYKAAVAPYYYCDIRGARISSTGTITQVGPNICGADNHQFSPSVASIGGNFLVSWEDYRASGSPVIYYGRVSSAGAVQDGSGIQASSTTAWQQSPSVTTDGTNYFIAWTDKRIGWSNDNIYAQRVTAAGVRLDPSDILVCGSSAAQTSPSAAWNGTNFVVAWQDRRNAATSNDDIYLNQVTPAGAVVDATDSLISAAPEVEMNPLVLAPTSGSALVLYSNFFSATHRTAGRIASQAPPTPVVTDDGAFSTLPGSLHATWSVGSRQAEVAEYRYAVGTTPGGNQVLGWTSAGINTEVTASGLALADGGIYYISVQARNAAGIWGEIGASDGIIVETSAPTMPAVTDDGAYTTSSTSLHASWSSADPHTGVVEYQYAIGTSSGATDVVGWTSAGTDTTVTRTGLTLIDGTTYYFSVQARNGAGLWSATGSSDGILVDSSAPPVPTVADDGAYTTNTTSLHATWNCPDPQSGIEEYLYAIGTSVGATDVVDWTSAGIDTQVTKTGLTLSDGAIYYFSVKARNAAGLWSGVGSSDGIMADGSAPTTPVVTDDGAFSTSHESLHATWSSSDPHTGIVEYRYAIGTSAGATDIVAWTSTGTDVEVTATGLTLADGVTCYFSVQGKNAAGTWTASGTSDGIMIDGSAPTIPVVTDDGEYTQSLDTLHASWISEDPQSGIAEYRYAIGTSPGWNDVVDWTSVGTDTEVTATGLTLTEGIPYCFSVEARNGAGIWSAWGASNGIMVDATAPPAPTVNDDGAYSSSTTSLHASWSCVDPHTVIDEYVYAIGTSVDPTSVLNWTSAGPSTDVTANGLSLLQGSTYIISVKARNAAGLWSPVGASNGITIDSTAPTTPVVTDDGDYSASTDSLHATWVSMDAESGIAEYKYAVGTSAGATDVLDWTSNGSVAEVTHTGLALTEGVSYFISVKAQSSAGAWSEVGASNGIVVEASAPTTPIVTDDGNFTASLNSLHAVWTAADPQTGIQEYRYAIGTSTGATDVVGWTSTGTTAEVTKTGLSLTGGSTYYFSVQAKNGAGAWSEAGSSDGIVADGTAPTTPAVTDDGEYALPGSLHATWNADDPESGVVEYQYAIGTSAGAANVAGWTSAGTGTEITHSGLSLSEGVAYYISVKARNAAGLWSLVGSSDGISVPPAVGTVIEAKFMPGDTGLRLTGKLVSAGTDSLPDLPGAAYFFIEDANRQAGIKIVSSESVPTGGIVDIAGILETIGGERQITASDIELVSTGATVPTALNMIDRAIGGYALNEHTPGVKNSSGPNNLGLLIKTWGKVSYVGGAGENFVYVNGGSFLKDGSGIVGVKVYCGSLPKPAFNSTVLITGISSCEPIGSDPVRRVLATEMVEYP